MRVLFFANTDWYLYNFRLPFAIYLRGRGWVVDFVCPAGDYSARIRDAGFTVHDFCFDRRSVNPLSGLLTVVRFSSLCRRLKPNVVHSFTVKCVLIGSMGSRLAGVPARVNAIAGLGYIFSSSSGFARVVKAVVRKALSVSLSLRRSLTIFQNPDDVAALTGVIPDDRVRLIKGSGVNMSRFKPTSRRICRGGKIRCLFAARLLREKGIEDYIGAARILAKAQPGRFEFLVAGEIDTGNPGSVSADEVAAWADEGLATFLGHVDDMDAVLSTVDVFVLPSYYGEGVPRSLIEAAASSVGLVATDSQGCREVVFDGETGCRVPIRSPEAIAAALIRLADDPGSAEKMAANARDLALTEFDEKVVFERTEAVYRELCSPAR